MSDYLLPGVLIVWLLIVWADIRLNRETKILLQRCRDLLAEIRTDDEGQP